MSDRDSPAADALALVREALSSDESGRAAGTFMRGLTLGALIGAAIAGSAVWQRRERRRHEAASVEPRGQDRP
jgi:hypothetical protein